MENRLLLQWATANRLNSHNWVIPIPSFTLFILFALTAVSIWMVMRNGH